MKRYKVIKKFGNAEIGLIFVETNITHPLWHKKVYVEEGTDFEKDNSWVLENHIQEKDKAGNIYFERIN